MLIQPYLILPGNCRAAFEHYHKVLGGTLDMQTHGDIPAQDREQGPPMDKDSIMHARLAVGDQVLMGSDDMPGSTTKIAGFSVSVTVDSVEEAERVFAGLSQGGTVTMPLQETFWAPRFGMCRDQFGAAWMVNMYHKQS
jgi:PhnB protein